MYIVEKKTTTTNSRINYNNTQIKERRKILGPGREVEVYF